MCTTGAPRPEARVVFPDPAGPSTQMSLPPPSVGGRERVRSRTRDAPEGLSTPAVARDRVHELVARQQVDGVGVLEELAGLRVAEPQQVADLQEPGGPPDQ